MYKVKTLLTGTGMNTVKRDAIICDNLFLSFYFVPVLFHSTRSQFNQFWQQMTGYDVTGYGVTGYAVTGYDVTGYDVTGYDVTDYDVTGYDVFYTPFTPTKLV